MEHLSDAHLYFTGYSLLTFLCKTFLKSICCCLGNPDRYMTEHFFHSFIDNYDSFLLATGEQADSYYNQDKTHINMEGTRKLLNNINGLHQIITTPSLCRCFFCRPWCLSRYYVPVFVRSVDEPKLFGFSVF